MPMKFGKGIGDFLVQNLVAIMAVQFQIVGTFATEFRTSLTFDRIPNFFMYGKTVMSSFVYDAFACQILCKRELKCSSFNFKIRANKEGKHLCTLLDKVKQSHRGLQASNRFDFYSVVPKLPRSCSHAKSLGYRESRNYTIDPDARLEMIPFQVFCDMSDKDGVGVTLVSHDSMARTYVTGCEQAGCYRRDVQYDGISDVKAQLGALTKVSTHCEQYLKYECYSSQVSSHSWLVSRDGRRLNYWGGAPPNSGKCACGVAGNCAGGGKCNCDINTLKWREDSGLLSHKEDLPITMLRFGDVSTSQGEKGWHTLGKLRCYGQA